MKVYRVTGWDPKNEKEYNLGLVIATTKEQAIEKKQNKQNEELVLDACFIGRIEKEN